MSGESPKDMPRRRHSTCSRKQGITRALVGGAGDIVAGDPPPAPRGWKVAIAPVEPGKEGPTRCSCSPTRLSRPPAMPSVM